MLEIYAWAGVFTAMSVVRPHECREPGEWLAALIAGAAWPLVVAVRLTRWVQRNRRVA
jgi:hypothetical protein